MKLTGAGLDGAFIVEPRMREDERGFFMRTWCRREFAELGLNPALAQCGASFNRTKGTLRGMHYQSTPHEEDKLVRCTMGAVYDVMIDLRPGSVTFMRWAGVELSSQNRRMVYIPKGFAHGFLTLVDGTEVCYQISEFYHPECAKGVRWDDPAFGIEWPGRVAVISGKDAGYADFAPPGANPGANP